MAMFKHLLYSLKGKMKIDQSENGDPPAILSEIHIEADVNPAEWMFIPQRNMQVSAALIVGMDPYIYIIYIIYNNIYIFQ
jgi:hypothetical protein